VINPFFITNDNLQFVFPFLFGEISFLVAGIDVIQFRLYPYLQEPNLFLPNIVFFVPQTCSGTHNLYLVLSYHVGTTHGIFMIHLTLQHNADDSHVHMRVKINATDRFNQIII